MSPARLRRSIEPATVVVRGGVKMRSATSLFKNVPGSSKIVMHWRRGLRNVPGLPDKIGIICQKAVLSGGAAMPSLIAGGAYLANRPGKEVENARAPIGRIVRQHASAGARRRS